MFACDNLEVDATMNLRSICYRTPDHKSNKTFMGDHAAWGGLRALVVLALAASGVVAVCGCGSGGGGQRSDTGRQEALAREGREVFRAGDGAAVSATPGDGEQSARGMGGVVDEGWTIVLAAFSGTGHGEQASQTLARVQQETGLRGVRVQERGRGSAVVYGSYPSPTEARAQRDLERVRATVVDERRVFAGAFLAPPRASSLSGRSSQHSLARAREEFGPGVRYTLQIAVYESSRREEAMRAAEEAVLRLRREGEPAFFHHGSSRSMVTVGAFTAADAQAFLDRAPGQTTGGGSAMLWELFRRHPQNLFNGNQPLLIRGEDGRQRAQRSFLVGIP